jgi:hypothetical protein
MAPPSYMQSVVDRNVVMRRIPVSESQDSMYDIWANVSKHTWPTFPWNKFCPSKLFHYLTQSMWIYPHYETPQLQHPTWSTNAQRFIRNNCLFLTISKPNNYTLTHSWKQKIKCHTSLMPTTSVRHGWISSVFTSLLRDPFVYDPC